MENALSEAQACHTLIDTVTLTLSAGDPLSAPVTAVLPPMDLPLSLPSHHSPPSLSDLATAYPAPASAGKSLAHAIASCHDDASLPC